MLRRLFWVPCLCAALGGCNEPRPWHEVSPPEGHFTVAMPVQPREAVQTANTAWGPLQVRFFEAETDNGSVVYSVTYTDYPFDALDPDKARALLVGAQQSTVRDISGTVQSESATSHGSNPARRTAIRAASGVEYEVLVVLAGSRLYQVFTASRPGKLDPAAREKFFDSFRVQAPN